MKNTTIRYKKIQVFRMLITGLFLICSASAIAQENDLFDSLGIIRFKQPIKMYEFSLKSTEGKTVRFEDFKGKVVFLNFWTTW